MEKLKDPAMLLSVANSIGIVGSTAYFYKQLETMRAEMVKMSQVLTTVLRKVAEVEKGDQHKNETIHALSEQIKRLNEQIERIPTFEHIDNIDVDISEIIDVLCENNIPVERPSQAPRGRRSGDRRDPRRDCDIDDRRYDRRESSARTSTMRSRTDTSRDFDSRPQSTRSARTQPAQSTQRPQPTPRQDTRQDVKQETYDDDLDLIGEVRRQTHS